MKIEKKHIIAGGLAVISVALAAAYWQYTKLMNFKISLKKAVFKKISLTNLDVDLYLNFLNNSTLDLNVLSQSYDVYLNGSFVAKIQNNAPVSIAKSATSIIPLNVKINPTEAIKKLGKGVGDLILNIDKAKLKIDAKLKVKIWGININIPFVYEATIAEMKSAN